MKGVAANGEAKRLKFQPFERDKREFYTDPPSCAAALFEVQPFTGAIFDPCAGMGNCARMAERAGYEARAADIDPDRERFFTGSDIRLDIADFLKGNGEEAWADNIVMNPPYGSGPGGRRLEELFIERALVCADGKVAALLPLTWFVARKTWLEDRGLCRVWAVTPRPSMLPGANGAAGEKPGGGMSDYAWFIFLKGFDGMPTLGHAVRDTTLDSSNNWTWRLGR